MEYTLLSLIFPLQGLKQMISDRIELAHLEKLLEILEANKVEKSLIVYGQDSL
jgi:hypothetical protein